MTGLARLSPHRWWLIALCAVIGLGISLAAWRFARQAEENRILDTYRRRSDTQVHLARARLALYEEMVHHLQNLFTGSERVTREEFERTADQLLFRHPGVQALQWVAVVGQLDHADFEQEARTEYPGFAISERAPDGRLRAAAPGELRTVIRLVAPLADNEPALGYDTQSAPSAPIYEAAARTRQLTASMPFRLIQSRDEHDESGVVFALPVFGLDQPGRTERLRGFTQCVFRIETMLGQTHRQRRDESLTLHYVDLDAPAASRLLYANRAGLEVPVRTTSLAELETLGLPTTREVIAVGGRRWQLTTQMDRKWRDSQRTTGPALLLGAGLVTTFWVLLGLGALFRRAGDIEEQVTLRTAELERTKHELEDDIRRRREAEAALLASEARLQAILDHSPLGIFVKDLEGRYVLANRRHAAELGLTREQILGKTDREIIPADAAEIYTAKDRSVIASGENASFEVSSGSGEKKKTSLVQKFLLRDADKRAYAICGIVIDLTDRIRAEQEKQALEQRLQETQRLESLGVLAGGVAHDFNNILTAILGNASLARAHLSDPLQAHTQLGQIERSARRAGDLCAQLLAYTGRSAVEPGRLDLAALIRDAINLVEVSIGRDKRLVLDLPDTLPPVLADPTQIRQIVLNLVINAAEALGERAGRIEIRLRSQPASKEELGTAVQHPDLPPGLYAALEVSDNGAGMSPEVLQRIFEPFFTTKFYGRGLGLSAVLGIVLSHRGALFVDSQPGRGTTFRLLLPFAPEDAKATAALDAADPSGAPPPSALRGTVLLVDDEPAVREMGAMALRHFGLEVVEAADGLEALAACRAATPAIDLVLLDLTMPNLSGEETLRQMRAQGSRQKVILMSGYSANASTERCRQLGAVAFIHKPFELTLLARCLAQHLPGPASTDR